MRRCSMVPVDPADPANENEIHFQLYADRRSTARFVSCRIVITGGFALQSQPMATTVATPTAGRKAGRIIFRIVSAIFILAVIALAVALIWFYRATHASLAQLDGAITTQGLQ